MKKLTIAAGMAALMFSGAAVAQTGGWQKGERGGDLTRAEAVARADAAFQRLDINNDGRITPEEMRQARQQMQGERKQRMEQRLAQLTPEQRERLEQRRAQRAERGGERGRHAGQRGERRGGEARGARMFGEQGYITQAQFRERALQRFDRMDLNNDGVVTAEERRQARQQMRQRFQERRGQR